VAEYYPVETLEDTPDGLVVEFSSADPAVATRLLVRLGSQAELLDGEAVARARDDLQDRVLERYGVTRR
jgi:hypothetical protein